MTADADERMTLVLCGTGTTGSRVASRLTERGARVRVGSRSGAPPFDWTDAATWSAALDGVGSVYVVYYPDFVVPGAVEAVGRFAELAVSRDVRRLVMLSGRGEEQSEAAERALQASGAEWTIVRSSFFAQDFSEKFFLEPVLRGSFAFPAGKEVTEPFVDAADIADIAVAALTEDDHASQLYEATGPRLLSFAEAIGEIAQATGRQIDYQTVTLERYTAELRAEGLPEESVAALIDVAGVVLDGRNARLADGVRRALGREPRDFAVFARVTAATGVWTP